MTNDYEFTSFEIIPNVRVYQGLLPDVDELYKIMKESESDAEGKYYFTPWIKWGPYGTTAHQKHEGQEDIGDDPRAKAEKYLSDRVFEAYGTALKDYKQTYDFDFPESVSLLKSSFSKYDGNIEGGSNGLVMHYHTDFIISERDLPGQKFLLTCTTYINDDYEGGEIEFYVEDGVENKFYPYKPKAGDVLIFPSQEPYWHGVKNIKHGHKYFVRNYLTYYYDGHPDWLANQKMHGAYRWAKMEIERVDRENISKIHMKHVQRESK
jgi:hypothetical protein